MGTGPACPSSGRGLSFTLAEAAVPALHAGLSLGLLTPRTRSIFGMLAPEYLNFSGSQLSICSSLQGSLPLLSRQQCVLKDFIFFGLSYPVFWLFPLEEGRAQGIWSGGPLETKVSISL